MKLNDKYHWDGFIYNLIYPGFVGSMIYELIPATKSEATFASYFTLSTSIIIFITLFYCVDYLHLYGDMHTRYKTEKRSSLYLMCDVASSLFFFFAFVMVKLEHYQFALFFIAFIPLFFTTYKFKNKADKYFHIPYSLLSIATWILCLLSLHKVWEIKFITDDAQTLFWFSVVSLSFYCIYVFFYYDRFSKNYDPKPTLT